jgi:hypothetical protein
MQLSYTRNTRASTTAGMAKSTPYCFVRTCLLQWAFWAQRLPELTCLHTGLAYPVKPGRRGGLLGWGVFEGLRELHLHSTGGQPIR